MEHYNIILDKIAISTEIVVKSIPLRLYAAVKNKLVLTQLDIGTIIEKAAKLTKAKFILGISSFTPLKTIFERGTFETILDSTSKAVSEKRTGTGINVLEIGSNVASCYLTQYRLLGGMDSDGTTTFDLASFDDKSIEDLDYVII